MKVPSHRESIVFVLIPFLTHKVVSIVIRKKMVIEAFSLLIANVNFAPMKNMS